MKKELWLVVLFGLSACTNSKISSDRVFSNAQVLYQKKEQNSHVKQAALQMPSYFLELEYEQGQTNLSPAQVKKVEAMLKKIVYPDEYKIYASFGSSGEKNQVVNLAPVFKRAEDIKSRYSKRVKEVKVAYLKNQKPDCVYIRLLA
ncbi:hypothetical protein OQJ19_07995 [Fluoribacter gormanii]|uniref:Lipoprotein n=1 Tax=Fluoribacter gormanii TaxID=464 RepID=A0A377GN90_9GAMM|nr:hypothetical protein [Fluoribacter gormanii]KTD04752.1 hypothetical protein Lgor_0834 [Fluoribacter gormanii]MCW8445388.1 hypothetical protein [Fluoribacter gormanii]MCW8470593.1 hypothetical protein [Fluoribacter gormanii]SIR15522.1 hypothetical protein SAMN05421777_10766 [Fluoribacter gormanii]STO26248.1 Uncharacterised protein [Fluoribacter gormanii]